jgi:hypothetical protein
VVSTATKSSAPSSQQERRALIRFGGFITLLVLGWILMTPMGGGADENHHLVRSAAVVRGQITPTEVAPGRPSLYQVPAWLWIDVDCFKLQPEEPASCAFAIGDADATIGVPSPARQYPIWGHILPGLPTLVTGGTAAVYLARIFDAAIPVALFAVALTIMRRSRIHLAATLLAVTPMAWFMIATVNPSGLVLAGALAMWVGLIFQRHHAWAPWLLAAGWAATILPRRDGIIWVAAILMVYLVYRSTSLIAWFTSLARGPQITIAVSTVLALGGAAISGNRIALTGLVVPVVVAAIEVARWAFDRAESTAVRVLIPVAVAVAGVVGALVVFLVRPGGPDTHLASRIISQTGLNLYEAVGVLGWLDAPVPLTIVMLVMIALGLLIALAVLFGEYRTLIAVGGILLLAIAASWVLELYSGNRTSTYWQGRYYLGFLMGIPLLLAGVPGRHVARFPGLQMSSIAIAIGGIASYAMVGAFWATGRRFGVGVSGSLKPWTWDSYGSAFGPGDLGLFVTVVAGAFGVQLWRLSRQDS